MGNTTMWRLDGGDNNDYMANGNLPFPFPDAVSQFSVESTALSAQNGMHTGGLVNVVTRSGTNTYHGSAFEFIRNNYLDATNFFSSTPEGHAAPEPVRRHLRRSHPPRQALCLRRISAHRVPNSLRPQHKAIVPTAANLAGDFVTPPMAPTCTSSGKSIQLFDPLTGAKLTGNKYPTPPTYNAQSLALY